MTSTAERSASADKPTTEQSTSTTESGEDSDDMLSLAQQLDSNFQAEDVETWLNADRNDQGYELLSDEDIVKQVTEGDDPEVTEDENDDDSEEVKNVPSS